VPGAMGMWQTADARRCIVCNVTCRRCTGKGRFHREIFHFCHTNLMLRGATGPILRIGDTRDEGGPFGVGNQVPISSHRKLLSSKAMVVNVAENAGT
jgi:hypothetical protein